MDRLGTRAGDGVGLGRCQVRKLVPGLVPDGGSRFANVHTKLGVVRSILGYDVSH
jgi:hypothetical protein